MPEWVVYWDLITEAPTCRVAKWKLLAVHHRHVLQKCLSSCEWRLMHAATTQATKLGTDENKLSELKGFRPLTQKLHMMIVAMHTLAHDDSRPSVALEHQDVNQSYDTVFCTTVAKY